MDETIKEIMKNERMVLDILNNHKLNKTYLNLIKENENLENEIQKEIEFENSRKDSENHIENRLDIVKRKYLFLLEDFRKLAYENSQYYPNLEQSPIMQDLEIHSYTTAVLKQRYETRIIDLKSSIIKLQDQLHDLISKIYCLDSDEDITSYGFEKIDPSFSDLIVQKLSTRESTANSSPLTESIDLMNIQINQALNEVTNNTDKSFITTNLQFHPNKLKISPQNDIRSNISSTVGFDRNSTEINQLHDKISSLISSISAEKNTSISISSPHQSFFKQIFDQLSQAQFVINKLSQKISNKSISPQTWKLQSEINDNLKEIVSQTNSIIDPLKAGPSCKFNTDFSNILDSNTVELEELPSDQLQKCESQISHLQESINSISDVDNSALQHLHERVNLFEDHIKSNSYQPKSAFKCQKKQIQLIEDKNTDAELDILRQQYFEKKKESASHLQKVYEMLPAYISEKNIEVSFPESQTYHPMTLPDPCDLPINSDSFSTLNSLMDSNQDLLLRLDNKSFEFQSSNNETFEFEKRNKFIGPHPHQDIINTWADQINHELIGGNGMIDEFLKKRNALKDRLERLRNEEQKIICIKNQDNCDKKKQIEELKEKIMTLKEKIEDFKQFNIGLDEKKKENQSLQKSLQELKKIKQRMNDIEEMENDFKFNKKRILDSIAQKRMEKETRSSSKEKRFNDKTSSKNSNKNRSRYKGKR